MTVALIAWNGVGQQFVDLHGGYKLTAQSFNFGATIFSSGFLCFSKSSTYYTLNSVQQECT
ncbi:hypothetical protein KC19_2G166100 [Ceratodon purpureus]|uniref:Uncharacterized protein n=1 Tax=Ceratodon purpureus TaxID=3225 RepID=A0A8T0IXJ8_CERPU|nr:hypothetical protein KC19_2G166100 [Ceratodon purpureus]